MALALHLSHWRGMNSHDPWAYPVTSTTALTTATLPYALQLPHQGLDALRVDPGFGKEVNTFQGSMTSKPVAEALGRLSQYTEFAALL